MTWKQRLESQAAEIRPSPLERELAGRQIRTMGPPEPWSDEDTENLARLTEVLQERDAARQAAVGWFKATQNWCLQCQRQDRTIDWLVWAVFVLSAWIVIDALCHFFAGRWI